jgi:hypothetical protein
LEILCLLVFRELCIFLHYSRVRGPHYRIRALCRAPKTHGTAFAVRIMPKRTAKDARRIFARKDLCRAPWGKAMHNIALRHAQYVTHDKEKGLTAVRGETASHSLYRAPLRTHGNGGTLCRASRGAAHDKKWSRRTVDHALCHASRGGVRQRMVQAHGGPCPLPCVVPLGARAKDGPGARCTSPIAVRLPHGARQIDLIFYFFLIFTSKNSQKT